jgi:hypothetical protein
MAQANDKYTQELSNGIISSDQAETLIELKHLLANLEEVCVAIDIAESN